MKRIKPELAVCLSAFLSFCILCGAGTLFQTYPVVRTEVSVVLSELLAFIPAILLLYRLAPNFSFAFFGVPKRPHPVETTMFVCVSGAAVTFLSFILNYIFYFLTSITDISLDTAMVSVQGSGGANTFFLIASVLVPAIIEEVYLRGVVQSVIAPELDQKHIIIFSGILFAILHASLQNFIGPLVAGCYYAWLVCALGSVWYAVLAHCIHSVLFYGIGWLLEFFGAFGIWARFPAISLILFLLFFYISLRFAERLVVHHRFDPVPVKKYSFRFFGKLFGNIAMLALLFAFIAKAVFGVL